MQLSLLLSFLIATAAALTAPSNAHPLLVDAAHSKMTVAVWKQGLFAFAADNHQIDAPLMSGSFDPTGHTVQIVVDATKMRVLDPHLAPDKRAQVQSNMVGPQVLDVQKYPQITFRSTKVDAADGDRLMIVGDLTLHGQTHPVTVRATKLDDRHYKGSASIKQTAFGITPIRIAGGLVKVKDDVDISFDIVLKP